VKAELRAAFAQKTVAEWRARLSTLKGQWAPHQNLVMLSSNPQVIANGLTVDVDAANGSTFKLVAIRCSRRAAARAAQGARGRPAYRGDPARARDRLERIAELKKSGAINDIIRA